jgi:hypothetical protein
MLAVKGAETEEVTKLITATTEPAGGDETSETWLYTVLLPLLAFAAFGSSRHLVAAADSATAASWRR